MSLHPPREASRATNEGIIISKYPDVCRSPTAPVPYTIVAYQHHDANTASSVFMTGQRAHKQNSIVIKCMGDEPGVGLGVKSGTVSSICHRKEHSKTVRIEGQWATRDTDEWWMNNRNTTGKLCWPKHNKTFDPTPPFQEYAQKPADRSDEGRIISDAPAEEAEEVVMGAQYAQNATAVAPSYGQLSRGGAVAQPSPSPSPGPSPSPQTNSSEPNKSPPTPANENYRRWWRWVRNVLKLGRPAAAIATSPVVGGSVLGGGTFGGAAGGAGYLGIQRYQTIMKNGLRESMGLSPLLTTPLGTATYEHVPLGALPALQEQKLEEEDHDPAANGRSAQNLSIKEKEEEERKKRCRVLPYKALQGTCQANEQAHHIVPDYTLRYGTRDEGTKGLKRIGDGGGGVGNRSMPSFPSFWEGPAICLTGNAKDDGTEHWEAHGADKVIAAAGAKPGDINPIGTARIGDIKEWAALHTINARKGCAAEIRMAIDKWFPDQYDNRLARTTESLPTGDALDWLKQGVSMTRH